MKRKPSKIVVKSKIGEITQKEFETGIYHFMLDHAQFFDEECYRVTFNFKNKQDLMRRIYARATGVFIAIDSTQIEKKLLKKHARYKTAIKQLEQREGRDRKLEMFKVGTFWQKILRRIILRMRELERSILDK